MNPCSHCGGTRCRAGPHGPLGGWAGRDPGHARLLSGLTLEQRFAPGDALFRMGEASRGLYCVAEGMVGLRMLHPNGAGALVDIAYPGDLVGVRAFLRDGCHRTGAEALTSLQVCKLPTAAARQLVASHPQLYRRLVRVCLDALDASQEAMLQAAAMDNRERLFHLLSRLLHHCGSPVAAFDGADAIDARLPVSREDLASMLGVRQETLSRLLKRLSDQGLIEISGRQCRLWPGGGRLATRPTTPLAAARF